MKPGAGNLDRAIRALAGIVLRALLAFGVVPGVPGIVALVAGLVPLLTAARGRYSPCAPPGIDTCAR